jgi:hypothetical protein
LSLHRILYASAAVAGAVALTFFAFVDLESADKIASVCCGVGFLLGVAGGALSRKKGSPPPPLPTSEQRTAALAALADAAREQRVADATDRGVKNAPVAEIGWTVDGAENSLDSPAGSGLPTRVFDAWQAAPGRWLYVKGDAGSGKTTFADLLVGQLLDRRAEDPLLPAPVLLSAESWRSPTVSFADWRERKIRETYGFLNSEHLYGTDVVNALVSLDELLVIVDGLDEMDADHRRQAMTDLYRHHNQHRLILTSRYKRESECEDLARNDEPTVTELELCSLRPAAAMDYLQAGTAPTADKPTLGSDDGWETLRPTMNDVNSPIGKVLRNPLYASLAKRMYQSSTHRPKELVDGTQFSDDEALRIHLVFGFIAAAFCGTRPKAETAVGTVKRANVRWSQRKQKGLSDIAEFLDSHNRKQLEWWRLEAAVTVWAWIVTAVVVSGILYGLTDNLPSGLRRGAPLGFIAAAMILLSRGRLSGIQAALRIGAATFAGIAVVGWAQYNLGQGLIDGLELGVGVAICITYVSKLSDGWKAALRVAGRAGLVLGVLMGAIDSLQTDMRSGLVRLTTTGLGVVISVGMPLALISKFESYTAPSQPGRLNRSIPKLRPMLADALVGIACGLGVGSGGALVGGARWAVKHTLVEGIHYGVKVGVTFSISIGLGIGLVGGLVHYLTTPSNKVAAADPRSTLRASRAVALSYLIVPGITCATSLYLLSMIGWSPQGMSSSVGAGGGLGLSLGLVFAAAFTAWPTYIIGRAAAFCAGLPFDLMRLCTAAQGSDLMRVEGAVFQWKHNEIGKALRDWEPRDVADPISFPRPRADTGRLGEATGSAVIDASSSRPDGQPHGDQHRE